MLKVNDVQLVDRIQIPSERTLTDAGQMHVPCKFARTGSQLYTAKQLGLVDKEDNEVMTVWRDEADVFDEESMKSFRSAPVTLGHPITADGAPSAVTAENAKELQVGMLEGMPVQDEDTLGGLLVLTTKEAIDALEDGTQELSAGYTCDIFMDEDGRLSQRNIRANHIAIVDKGRAGSSCRISDDALEVQEAIAAAELADAEALVLAEAQAVADAEALVLAEAQAVADAEAAQALLISDAVEIAVAEQALVVDKLTAEKDSLEVQLADAKLAAEESVVARCGAIENARLVADLRDVNHLSVSEIERMVVVDQMPEKDFTGKSDAYISAMFEILVDASKGETPMGKLLSKQDLSDTTVSKPVDRVAKARLDMINRSKAK